MEAPIREALSWSLNKGAFSFLPALQVQNWEELTPSDQLIHISCLIWLSTATNTSEICKSMVQWTLLHTDNQNYFTTIKMKKWRGCFWLREVRQISQRMLNLSKFKKIISGFEERRDKYGIMSALGANPNTSRTSDMQYWLIIHLDSVTRTRCQDGYMFWHSLWNWYQ